jgi:two-component system nitrogen regulation response regulator GlnG
MPKLLVIDDEPNIIYTIRETLGSSQLEIMSANTAKEGIEIVQRMRPDVVLLDVRLPDMSGLDAFDRIHDIDPRIPVIIMTAFARTETAIEAMRRGAFEYFVKPVDLISLRGAVERAIHTSRMSYIPALVGHEDFEEVPSADLIVGRSSAMNELYKTIGRVAPQDVTVLIQGESGTGKELVARSIYSYSKRSQLPFLAVNCAAISESLLESELFGHEKGAFTGADQRRIGKFEQVNKGTIFLDEIGDMSPATQAKSLRLLQQQQFERLGGSTTIQTDVRIIAATNKDLAAMVAQGTFRQDLYYRLCGFTLNIPPLRERKDDIPRLANYFLKTITHEMQRPITRISDEALRILERHSWPGNVRELYSAIRFAVVQTTGDSILPAALPVSCREDSSDPSSVIRVDSIRPETDQTPAGTPLHDIQQLTRNLLANDSRDLYRKILQEVEQVMFREVLDSTDGNQVQAADRLGISRMTLRSKLKSFVSDHPAKETEEVR